MDPLLALRIALHALYIGEITEHGTQFFYLYRQAWAALCHPTLGEPCLASVTKLILIKSSFLQHNNMECPCLEWAHLGGNYTPPFTSTNLHVYSLF